MKHSEQFQRDIDFLPEDEAVNPTLVQISVTRIEIAERAVEKAQKNLEEMTQRERDQWQI